MFNYVECRSCGKTNELVADSMMSSAKCSACDAVLLNISTTQVHDKNEFLYSLYENNLLTRNQVLEQIDINDGHLISHTG